MRRKESYLVHKKSNIIHELEKCHYTRGDFTEVNYERYFTMGEAEAKYGADLKKCKLCFK